jgi:hypothetical protein
MAISSTLLSFLSMKRNIIPLSCIVVSLALTGGSMAAAQTEPSGIPAHAKSVLVPFVGCASDGQLGPEAAPKGKLHRVTISAFAAQHLAWYKAEYGFGVLAARGWNCFSTYGSNGSSLFVTPDPIHPQDFFGATWKGFTGPVIQVSVADGGTSGRFDVSRAIARYFPSQKAFLHAVIAEGIESASDFPAGPYPTDRLMRIDSNMVEFKTPANARGQGTNSWLLPNACPIHGLVFLFHSVEDLSLLQLAVRLPKEDSYLLTPILQNSQRGLYPR